MEELHARRDSGAFHLVGDGIQHSAVEGSAVGGAA